MITFLSLELQSRHHKHRGKRGSERMGLRWYPMLMKKGLHGKSQAAKRLHSHWDQSFGNIEAKASWRDIRQSN
jgi:hypothetical protein